MEKSQIWDSKVCLENAVSVACQQVPENTKELDAKEKAERLGAIITQLKHDNDDLHAIVDPGTPSKEEAEIKGTIQDFMLQMEEMEHETPTLEDFHVMQEFRDFFPNEIPGLPPKRDIDFTIDLVRRAILVSKTPYRMSAPNCQR